MIDVYPVRLAGPPCSGCLDAELRAILAGYTDAIEIVHGANGKPALANGAVHFNVSHSGAWGLVAVSRTQPIGVDIEAHRPLHGDLLAKRFFTAREAALVAGDPARFFTIWTRKEAWLKAQGLGLQLTLDEVDVWDALAGWTFVDLDIAPGYAAAVAVEGTRDAPSLRRERRDGAWVNYMESREASPHSVRSAARCKIC